MPRALKIREEYIEQVKLAVKRNGFPTQQMLAEEVQLARCTVSNFLNGKAVDVQSFIEICRKLALEWKEIANFSIEDAETPADHSSYVERLPVETQCYEALLRPGALLRIKAPTKMGKTLLAMRTLTQIHGQTNFQTAVLSFELADQTVFTDLSSFSQWFCAATTQELKLPLQLQNHWKTMWACNFNTTKYFEEYLLQEITTPFVLVLDNTDRVFEHFDIAQDFCRLLRNWHDQANRGDRTSHQWQLLRMVIIHATEVYGALDINFSPLAGVGVVIDLPEFDLQQAKLLAQRKQLDWNDRSVQQLIDLVGGHPHLLQLAFDYSQQSGAGVDTILQTAATEAGIYSNHLRQLLSKLDAAPDLRQLFQQVVMAEGAVQLKPIPAFQLHSMGLISKTGDQVKPRCNLYREYFRHYLSYPADGR